MDQSAPGAPEEKSPGLDQYYDQIEKMAIGGMAEVYRGRQKSLDRPVAIKRIRPELKNNRDIQERFRREAKSSANLLHQNLAHVYDYLHLDGEHYIIMEWIDGFDLAEIIEKMGALPIDVATMVAIRLLNGIAFIHTHGMIHRDIKPDNVRLNTRGDIKIMDFGIALDPGEANLTMPGTLIGSPHYLAPEQITGAKLDTRADLFAFGITLYEMLTAKKPFFETQSESVYTRIQKGEFTPPEKLRADVPAYLSKIISDCLEVKPTRRPDSADKVAIALTQFAAQTFSGDNDHRIRQYLLQTGLLQGNPQLIEVVEKTTPPPDATVIGWAKRHWISVAVGALVVIMLGLGLYMRSQEQATLEPTPVETPKTPTKKNR